MARAAGSKQQAADNDGEFEPAHGGAACSAQAQGVSVTCEAGRCRLIRSGEATLIAAAAAEPASLYPVPADAPRYRHVPILKIGDYHPSGVQGVWHVAEELLRSFVETYDPFFFCAKVNTDHNYWWGPAQGLILSLATDGTYLYAEDMVILDPVLAWQIEQAMWPARSIEWWQEEILGKPFYERTDKRDYLTGLGFLGQQHPAIPELGPMPAAEPPPGAPPLEAEPLVIAIPLAARSERSQGLCLIPTQEVPVMVPTATAPLASVALVQTPTAAAQASDLERLRARNAELEAQLAAATGRAEQAEAKAHEGEQAKAVAEQARALVAAMQREKDVGERLQAHVRSGRLTTQEQRQAYAGLASQLYGAPGTELLAANGQAVKPEKPLLAQLDAIIAGFPAQITLGLVAREEPGKSDLEAKSPAEAAYSAAIAKRTSEITAGNGQPGGDH